MSERPSVCPECGAETAWDAQDRYKIGGHVFTERLQICLGYCGWHGITAMFPWRSNPPMRVWTVIDQAVEEHGSLDAALDAADYIA